MAELPPVLILGDHLGYPGNVMHGVTAYFLATLPALVESGVAIHACFLREPHPAAAELRERGIDPIFLSSGKWDPFVTFRVAAILREKNCTLVHAAGVKATLVARMAARLSGSRVIVHVHDLLDPSPLVGAVHRLFARPVDLGIGVSEAARKVLIEGYHIRPDRERVIHNGIPLDRMRSVTPGARQRIRAELGIAADAPVLAMIARMHPIKGHGAMLRIMARIVVERPSAVLVMAGDGPERDACEALAVALGLEANVRFLGSRSDVPELLDASDLVVVPSESEGLPTVAIEGCAAGLPVIGFDAGGLRDIIEDRVSGRLIRAGDEQAFAAALLEMLADDRGLARLGAEAAARAGHFTIANHVNTLIGCYREAAGMPMAGAREPAEAA